MSVIGFTEELSAIRQFAEDFEKVHGFPLPSHINKMIKKSEPDDIDMYDSGEFSLHSDCEEEPSGNDTFHNGNYKIGALVVTTEHEPTISLYAKKAFHPNGEGDAMSVFCFGKMLTHKGKSFFINVFSAFETDHFSGDGFDIETDLTLIEQPSHQQIRKEIKQSLRRVIEQMDHANHFIANIIEKGAAAGLLNYRDIEHLSQTPLIREAGQLDNLSPIESLRAFYSSGLNVLTTKDKSVLFDPKHSDRYISLDSVNHKDLRKAMRGAGLLNNLHSIVVLPLDHVFNQLQAGQVVIPPIGATKKPAAPKI